ncbi:sterol desaturase family protein [Algoriphagus sp. NF]|jgi:sterol desaturase/sphingolipid hydroxylase (fatty acid hydroxylase superfamily)|uniref:sterol desaturase family protein n=1 Tax=Algoriphagus sp. NF TaxID=2992756 RepID=UPI001066F589|nr:sterol desaturase family protein [Algoriphagus sp. NF]MDE0559951.1 sterol desaturase family protein [Algoriphagus sp. NF]
MEQYIAFFEDLPALYKLAWVVACLGLVWTLELVIPLVRHQYDKLKHDGVNLVFLSMSMVINVLVGIATVGVFYWISTSKVGILQWVELPFWAELLIAVMALDFIAQYVAHYMLHRVAWMWKFHLVHHSDTKVDATTGTRHHPGDYFIRELFSIATVIVFGIPVAFYVFYRICTVFFTYVTHANIELPRWIDKPLSFIFVTPNVHKFHHHFERPWTDTNFGNIFSIWDRLFGTFVYDDTKKIQYGVDVTDPLRDEDLRYQLGLPLNKSIKTDKDL